MTLEVVRGSCIRQVVKVNKVCCGLGRRDEEKVESTRGCSKTEARLPLLISQVRMGRVPIAVTTGEDFLCPHEAVHVGRRCRAENGSSREEM